jgi:DNA-binding transcriptional LysR family regulator
MNLRHLRTFVAVADAGGFGRALGRLHLSQPAASRQIDALEAELGVLLFERSGRGIRLTSSGEDLLRRSRTVVNEADSLRERARALGSGRTGLLRIGATPQVIESPIAGYLSIYRRKFPDVDVRLLEDGGARLPDRVLQGDVHVAILPAGDERLQGRPLFPMHLLAVLPKTHALRHRTTLEVTNLADNPVMVGSGFASRVWFDAACERAHFKPNVVFESAAPHTLIALVKSGYGIAVLPSSVSMLHEGLCVLPLVQARRALGRWAIAAWDAQRFQPPYAECFVEDLAAHCKRAYPGRHLLRRLPPLAGPA